MPESAGCYRRNLSAAKKRVSDTPKHRNLFYFFRMQVYNISKLVFKETEEP